MLEFHTNEEKILAIQNVVNKIFSNCSDPAIYGDLMIIDSICDVPLTEDF